MTVRLVACSSPSHDVFVQRWFLPTVPAGFVPDVVGVDQRCGSAEFMSRGWRDQMDAKLEVVAASAAADDEVVVFSDVDVRFFADFTPARVRDLLGDRDIAFQQGGVDGSVCAGFFVFRSGPAVRSMMDAWREEFDTGGHQGDETALNVALGVRRSGVVGQSSRLGERAAGLAFRAATAVAARRRPESAGVRWGYLPRTIWNPGLSHPGVWRPGGRLAVPRGVLVHHANYSIGVDDKLAQLATVEAIVARREGRAPRQVP